MPPPPRRASRLAVLALDALPRQSQVGLDGADNRCSPQEAHRAHRHPRSDRRHRRRRCGDRAADPLDRRRALPSYACRRRRRGQRNSTPHDIIAAVRQLVLIANDDLIAGILNRNRLTTGNGNRWTRERVTALRSHHKIPVFRPQPDGIEPWLNLTNAARLLGVAPKTLRLAAETGEIDAVHPLPDGPWIFSRAALGEPADTAHRSSRDGRTQDTPRDRIPISKTYSLQQHRQMGVAMQDCSAGAIAR